MARARLVPPRAEPVERAYAIDVLVADDNLAVDLPDEDRIDLFRAQSLDDCPKLAAFTFPVCGIAIERVRAQVGIDANPDAPANCVRHRTQRAGFP